MATSHVASRASGGNASGSAPSNSQTACPVLRSMRGQRRGRLVEETPLAVFDCGKQPSENDPTPGWGLVEKTNRSPRRPNARAGNGQETPSLLQTRVVSGGG